MTTEIFVIATQLNTEIEQLNTRLKGLLQLKSTIDNGYEVNLRFFLDTASITVDISNEEIVKSIIEALIERTERSIDDLTKEFNRL